MKPYLSHKENTVHSKNVDMEIPGHLTGDFSVYYLVQCGG